MASSICLLPNTTRIYDLGLQPRSSNLNFLPMKASSSPVLISLRQPIFKITHFPVIKREEIHHESNVFYSPSSRPTFYIEAAAASAPQETTYCIESQQDATHKPELETFSEHLSVFEGLGMVNSEIELLIRKHPFLLDKSSHFLTRRIHVLEAMGIDGANLICLLKRQPSTFIADIEPTLEFINESIQGFNIDRFYRVLISVDHRLLFSFPDKIKLLLEHGVEESQIGNFLNKVNLKVFCERPLEDLNEVLIYLKDFKVEKEFWWIVLRRPALILLNVERDLIPRVKLLENLCRDKDHLNKLVLRFPWALGYNVKNMERHVEYLKSLFTEEDLVAIIMSYPQILSLSIEKTLKPRIQYLKQCNLKKEQIAKILIRYPTFLGVSFDENLSKKSALLQEIGFEPFSHPLAHALTTVTRISYENLQLTIALYLSYGLSYNDIYIMGTKQPQVLRLRTECLKPKIDYLINNMHISSKFLVIFPAFLGYSLEDRIRPRHRVMEELVSKGLTKEDYSIIRLLCVTNEDFIDSIHKHGYNGNLYPKMAVNTEKQPNEAMEPHVLNE
ncbi:hypothetical protein KI387_004866, partial [Taxus chinensis]